jgi:hypothetical protein
MTATKAKWYQDRASEPTTTTTTTTKAPIQTVCFSNRHSCIVCLMIDRLLDTGTAVKEEEGAREEGGARAAHSQQAEAAVPQELGQVPRLNVERIHRLWPRLATSSIAREAAQDRLQGRGRDHCKLVSTRAGPWVSGVCCCEYSQDYCQNTAFGQASNNDSKAN